MSVLAGAYPLFAHHIAAPEAQAVWEKLLCSLTVEEAEAATTRICQSPSKAENVTTAAFMRHVWNLRSDRAAAGPEVPRLPSEHIARDPLPQLYARWTQISIGGRVEPPPSERERALLAARAAYVRELNSIDGRWRESEKRELIEESIRVLEEARA